MLKEKRKTIQQSNKNKRTSMKKLSEREDFIITKADKGGAVVIVAVKDTERQLSSNKNYRKLPEDPTATNMKSVIDAIVRFKKTKTV